MILKRQWENWEKLPIETRNAFDELCENHEWMPVAFSVDDGWELLFLSPYPEVEWKIFGKTLEACIMQAVKGRTC